MALSALCDGTADCSNGNDETSPICESKVLRYLHKAKIEGHVDRALSYPWTLAGIATTKSLIQELILHQVRAINFM